MRLDGYIRVSRVGGREGESFISPDLQRQQIEDWARLRGAEIVAWHVDLDQSGGKLERPGLDAMMERIRGGLTDGIAVARLDRLSRAGVADALKLVEELTEREPPARLAAVDLGIDPTTMFGEFALTIMLALARMERRRIAESWSSAQERAVARGVHIASAAPTGYVRGEGGRLEPNQHAAAIAEAFRMRVNGASVGEVCRFLEARRVEGPYGGKRWVHKAVKRMFSNRVYLGEARSGEFVKAHAHPPVIDRATFEAVQSEPGTRTTGEGMLLTGLIRCAGCGFALKPGSMKDRDGSRLRAYRCRGEHGMGRCEDRAFMLARVVEPLVTGWFLSWLGDAGVSGQELTADRGAAEEVLAAAEDEAAFFRDDPEVRQVLGREGYVAGLRTRMDAVEEARRALVAIPVSPLPSRAMVEEVWPDLTIAERRRLLASGIDVIWLRTGRTLPPNERLAIFAHGTWTAGLPGQGLGRNATRAVVWDRLPDGARVSLAHDLRKRAGD